MTKPYCVAITGGSASGKTTVTDMFQALGVTIFSADNIARQLTVPGAVAFNKIFEHFGDAFLTNHGELNRRLLRNCIIYNPHEREWLENLLHPLIRQELQINIQHIKSPYCMVELPLLRERKDFPYIDRVLWVYVTHQIQCERLMLRDHMSLDEAINFLKLQVSSETYKTLANDKLDTAQPITSLEKEVHALHDSYLSLNNSIIASSVN